MASKGASNLYGYTKGSRNKKSKIRIGYAWAKRFNEHTLERHYRDHGKKYGSKEDYEERAVQFANTVDTDNNVSFIHPKIGTTYKYSKKTGEFAIIDKWGYIVTFFEPEEGYEYYLKQYDKYVRKRDKK